MIKGNDVTNPIEKHPMDFYQEVVFTAKIWQQYPSVTNDKEICQSHVIMS